MTNLYVEVILEHRHSGQTFRGTIPVPGSTLFTKLPSGSYRVTYQVPPGYGFVGLNPSTIDLGAEGDLSLSLSSSQLIPIEPVSPKSSEPQPPQVPVKALLGFALGASLLGDLSGLSTIFDKAFQPRPAISAPQPAAPAYASPLPATVTTRLKDCLQDRAIEIAGVPTLDNLLAELSWERQASSDFEYQLMQLYTRSQQLRSLISSCDPALLQDLLAARQKAFPDERVVVIHDRAAAIEPDSSGAYFQISVPFGTELELDHEALDQLPADQRAALDNFEGWLPVIFANGRSGFVDRASVRRQIAPPQI